MKFGRERKRKRMKALHSQILLNLNEKFQNPTKYSFVVLLTTDKHIVFYLNRLCNHYLPIRKRRRKKANKYNNTANNNLHLALVSPRKLARFHLFAQSQCWCQFLDNTDCKTWQVDVASLQNVFFSSCNNKVDTALHSFSFQKWKLDKTRIVFTRNGNKSQLLCSIFIGTKRKTGTMHQIIMMQKFWE